MTTILENTFRNPFKPGAGHMPPYLAGREKEKDEFLKLLNQDLILGNLIITGLRGTGKTVLLETLKPLAMQGNWLWVGTDLSESASMSEETIAIRLLTDLSVVTSGIVIDHKQSIGFNFENKGEEIRLDYGNLINFFTSQPGLIADKLKATLELVWNTFGSQLATNGIIFTYDEAQNLSDHTEKGQYPLSLLLDVFQSIQRKGIPFMLLLVGLPTLFSKLVEVRTYSERMFRILELCKLSNEESKDAIVKPIEGSRCPVKFDNSSIEIIVRESGGYPYFIQFICREVYDLFLLQMARRVKPNVPISEIIAKLDSDFFSGRWMRATDRQKQLLAVIASLDNCEDEFTVHDLLDKMKNILRKPLSASHTNQMLASLIKNGLIHKNRHGKYSLAVPLLSRFISRQNINLQD
ncbi:MAG: ATP-binding protein [Candidatus Gracilibacteria bacterium]|jgi:type II secretory pathway predicted ATPase ExeA